MFAVHDKDATGDLSWAQTLGMLQGLAIPEWGIQIIEKNLEKRDGKPPRQLTLVSFLDFHEWWRTFDDRLSFDSVDADQSGEPIDEIKHLFFEIGLQFDGIDALVDGFDNDKDGALSFVEFRPLSDLVRSRLRQAAMGDEERERQRKKQVYLQLLQKQEMLEQHRLGSMERMLEMIHTEHKIALPELKATCAILLHGVEKSVTKTRRRSADRRINVAIKDCTPVCLPHEVCQLGTSSARAAKAKADEDPP
jgi:hypothetical protein